MDEKLYEIVVVIADEEYDGHFTLMKFTTNWRCMFGTPSERKEIENAPKGKTADEAMKQAILSEFIFSNIEF